MSVSGMLLGIQGSRDLKITFLALPRMRRGDGSLITFSIWSA